MLFNDRTLLVLVLIIARDTRDIPLERENATRSQFQLRLR